MVDVKVVDSGGLSAEFFSGILHGSLLNDRSDVNITDNFEDHTISSFMGIAFVNKTYHIIFDADGDNILITKNSISGTLNSLKVSDESRQLKYKISGLNLKFGQIPTHSSDILQGDDNIDGSAGSNYLNGYMPAMTTLAAGRAGTRLRAATAETGLTVQTERTKSTTATTMTLSAGAADGI